MKHYNTCTKTFTKDMYRLLVIDGHGRPLDFMNAFKAALDKAPTVDNMHKLPDAGLVPLNVHVVLSKLDVRLHMPPPTRPTCGDEWCSQTPRNMSEFLSQHALIRKQTTENQNPSPTNILRSLNQFENGAERTAHRTRLLEDPGRPDIRTLEAGG